MISMINSSTIIPGTNNLFDLKFIIRSVQLDLLDPNCSIVLVQSANLGFLIRAQRGDLFENPPHCRTVSKIDQIGSSQKELLQHNKIFWVIFVRRFWTKTWFAFWPDLDLFEKPASAIVGHLDSRFVGWSLKRYKSRQAWGWNQQ